MIVSKGGKYFLCVFIANIPRCNCPHFTRMSSLVGGKRGQWVSCKHMYYMFKYLCKVEYALDKFIHAPTFNYNKVMCVPKLSGVVIESFFIHSM